MLTFDSNVNVLSHNSNYLAAIFSKKIRCNDSVIFQEIVHLNI